MCRCLGRRQTVCGQLPHALTNSGYGAPDMLRDLLAAPSGCSQSAVITAMPLVPPNPVAITAPFVSNNVRGARRPSITSGKCCPVRFVTPRCYLPPMDYAQAVSVERGRCFRYADDGEGKPTKCPEPVIATGSVP